MQLAILPKAVYESRDLAFFYAEILASSRCDRKEGVLDWRMSNWAIQKFFLKMERVAGGGRDVNGGLWYSGNWKRDAREAEEKGEK